MGIWKRLAENELYNHRRYGYKFTNDKPQVTFDGKSQGMNYDEFNQDVKSWAYDVSAQLKERVRGLKEKQGRQKQKLARSIRPKFRYDAAQINTIGFNLVRHGVFFAKGVGRGYVMSGDSVRKIAKSGDDTIRRKPKNWFNATLDSNIGELAEIVEAHAGDDIALNVKRMYII